MNITNIKFINFKGYANYSVSLDTVNILVGPNNSGKSTIIGALRALEYAIRIALSRKATRVETFEGYTTWGHTLSTQNIPISIENIHTNYSDEPSKIEFKLSNRNTLILFFPNDGRCLLYWSADGRNVNTPTLFAKEFPLEIQIVPVLGPVEKEETLVTDETLKRSTGTPNASRHFRNYWLQNPEDFSNFKALIESTWPGMSIKPPEMLDVMARRLVMFCSESNVDRELFWVGFGFQIWCQLLTHISRASKSDLIVIDEPEVYLHPDVQRQLLNILRETSSNIILATHSIEIIGEAEPSEILLIDKAKRSAKRLSDINGVDVALKAIGSIQNISLANLARTRKILFVEGDLDYKIIRKFAHGLGFVELSNGVGLTKLDSGGFTSWEKVKSLAWGIDKALSTSISIGAVYDRDYWCDDEVTKIEQELTSSISMAHIHKRKEIENYLLVPNVLERLVFKLTGNGDINVRKILGDISERHRATTLGQYLSKHATFHRSSGKDEATLNAELLVEFERRWSDLDSRSELFPGKEVLREFRAHLTENYAITLTDTRIINEFRNEEIPADLIDLVRKVEQFRTA